MNELAKRADRHDITLLALEMVPELASIDQEQTKKVTKTKTRAPRNDLSMFEERKAMWWAVGRGKSVEGLRCG